MIFEELVVEEYIKAHPPVQALSDECDRLIDGYGEFGRAFRALPKETQSTMLKSKLFAKWAVKYAVYTSKPLGEEN